MGGSFEEVMLGIGNIPTGPEQTGGTAYCWNWMYRIIYVIADNGLYRTVRYNKIRRKLK